MKITAGMVGGALLILGGAWMIKNGVNPLEALAGLIPW